MEQPFADINLEEAEVKLDLAGMERQAALEKFDATVKHCKKNSAQSLLVTFDAATPGGGETLFQPVMRYLKIEKMHNYVQGAAPVMREGKAGVFVVFRI